MSERREAARPKRPTEDAPAREPMRAADQKIRRAPSADQKKTRRLQTKTADIWDDAKGSTEKYFSDCPHCKGTGDGDFYGKCPHCGGSGERKYSVLKEATPSEAHTRGMESGYQYGHSFTFDDPYHPWNSKGEDGARADRMDIMVQRLPHDLENGDYGGWLTGFSQGVDRAHWEQRSAQPPSQDARVATRSQQNVEHLQPGDSVLTPTGQTVKVKRVRNHETSGKHLYIDTDAGTTMVQRGTQFTISPHNPMQQEIPGFGVPGANTNDLPFGGTPFGGGPHQNASGPDTQGGDDDKCPNCGSSGTLHRRGGNYVCSKCGFSQQLGPMGKNPLMDNNQVIRNFSSVNNHVSAIARQARQVLANMEESS